jgi:hypothetical protein
VARRWYSAGARCFRRRLSQRHGRHSPGRQRGAASLADQAALWQGANDRWIDLNALLPAQSGLNASAACSIECRGGRMYICGEASRYEVSDPDTDRESHFRPASKAVVWSARLLLG